MLYVMAERWPNIKRYRDAFETIKRSVISLIGDGKNEPREKLPTAIGDAWSDLNNFNFDMMETMTLGDMNQMFYDKDGGGIQNPTWDYADGYVYNGTTIESEGNVT